jgi:hypothetical protein
MNILNHSDSYSRSAARAKQTSRRCVTHRTSDPEGAIVFPFGDEVANQKAARAIGTIIERENRFEQLRRSRHLAKIARVPNR